ncbi:hypothetical protein COX24_00005, partial [bacterium (Candidatus Gribaldobacteria) CG23_combo_of_CG06-09_8_20_14_all_37_87_8]
MGVDKIFSVILVVLLLGFGFSVFAKTDLSLNVSDITFSKENALVGDRVKIFARVFNVGDVDVYGFVIFLINDKEIADPQPISVKVDTYDDVFIDWIFEQGTFNIKAKIVATRPSDESPDNDAAARESYFVDLDSDNDGIGDTQDNDNDNDGLTNDEEIVRGTDYLNPDTDKDKIKDSEDAFPLDVTEWQDTDVDGSGDNLDTDDDNDGLTDEEELFVYQTNPLSADTDKDLISDKREISIGFLKPDRNEWDLARLGLASMAAAVRAEVEKGNLLVGQ